MNATRYRCTNCGNVTRFDVTQTVTSKSYYHFTVGGELSVESEDIIDAKVTEISCRWCNSSKSIEEMVLDNS